MAKRKTTELPTITAAQLAAGDWFPVVDVSDTTDSTTGSNKKIAKSELAEAAGVTAHEADTTSVHGIADTSTLYRAGATDVAVADGGTGASTASAARTNLGVDYPTIAADSALTSRYAPLGHKAGWYVVAGTPGNSDAIPSEAVLHCVPLGGPLTTARAFDRISVISTLAGTSGAVVRLGIYASDEGGQPDALVLDAGTVDGTQTGVLTITISQTLQPGQYWLAAVVQGGAGTRTKLANSGATQSQGRLVLGGNNTWNQFGQNGYMRNSVTGALPSTFGTPTSTTGQATLVALRCA